VLASEAKGHWFESSRARHILHWVTGDRARGGVIRAGDCCSLV
jgi:hypothetical protein